MSYDEQIEALNERRMHAWSEQKRLLDHAVGERRPLTADERRESDLIDQDMDSLKDQVDQLERAKARSADMGGLRAEFDRIRPSNGRPGDRRDLASRSLGERLASAVAAVRDGSVATAAVELRTLTEGGAAGAVVPFEVGAAERTLRAASVVLQVPGVRVISMTADRLRIPRVAGVTVGSVAEAATVSTSDADVDSVDLFASKYGVMTLLSSELVDDCPADALEIFGQNLVESLGRKLDAHMLEGAGSGNDLVGLRNTPSVNTTSIAALPTSFDKLTDVLYEARVDNATPTAWIMHPRSWRVLSQIKTGLASDQTTLLEPNPQQGPQTLLGLPVLQSSQVTVTEGATNVGSWVAAVDGTQVLVGERRPARLEVSRDFAFDTDRVAVRATARYGFALLNPEGVSLGTDLRAA